MIRAIDLMHLGRPRVIAAYDVDGVIVDPGPTPGVEKLLAEAEPRALLLTHIHLDHAGSAGVICRRFPNVKVYVHERGAPHLLDPTKRLKSAGQLYGDDMARLWGEVVPVPERNIVALSGAETVEGFRVAYTPGHASHHVSYFHEETGGAFVGDVCGVRIPPHDYTLAPTPPPDIDLERWRESLATVAGWSPATLYPTHFGPTDDVDGQLERIAQALERFAGMVRESSHDYFVAAVRNEVRDATDAETAAALEQAAPFDHIYLGIERYWRKRAERDAA